MTLLSSPVNYPMMVREYLFLFAVFVIQPKSRNPTYARAIARMTNNPCLHVNISGINVEPILPVHLVKAK